MAKVNYQCKNCGKEKTYESSQKKHYPNRGKFCSMKCLYAYSRSHPTFNKWIDGVGYECMMMGGKQVRVHRYIMEQKVGRSLSYDECVHHINGIRNDNRLENLVVLKKGKHHQAHVKRTRYYKCMFCKKKFYAPKGRVRHDTFCSQDCYYKARRVGLYNKDTLFEGKDI